MRPRPRLPETRERRSKVRREELFWRENCYLLVLVLVFSFSSNASPFSQTGDNLICATGIVVIVTKLKSGFLLMVRNFDIKI